MTWTIDLPRGGRTRYEREIRDQWERLSQLHENGVEWLEDAVDAMDFSHCGFEKTVEYCRDVAECLQNELGRHFSELRDLYKACNWAHHPKNSKKYGHTDVDESHMSSLVSDLETTVDQIESEYGGYGSGNDSSSSDGSVTGAFAGLNLISNDEKVCAACGDQFYAPNYKGAYPKCRSCR